MLSEYQLQIIEEDNFSLGKIKNLSLIYTIKQNINSTVQTDNFI